MNTLFDYYVMMNYIVYKFYRKYEDNDGATISACVFSASFLFLPYASIDCIICLFSPEFQLALRQCDRWVYAIPILSCLLINYLILYRGGRYEYEFRELDKISDTEEFARRKRNTKIFMVTLIVVALVSLIVVSIINKSRF